MNNMLGRQRRQEYHDDGTDAGAMLQPMTGKQEPAGEHSLLYRLNKEKSLT
jgi:hypothetical protein